MNRLMLTTNSKKRKQTDVRTAQIILMLTILYLTAWTPYAIVSMIGQFGPELEDGQSFLGPIATTIPAFLAKTAVLIDPIVYGFSHPQFRFHFAIMKIMFPFYSDLRSVISAMMLLM